MAIACQTRPVLPASSGVAGALWGAPATSAGGAAVHVLT